MLDQRQHERNMPVIGAAESPPPTEYFDLKGALLDMGIAERSARRMLQGKSRMPPGVKAELAVLLRAEARRLDAMAAALEAGAPG